MGPCPLGLPCCSAADTRMRDSIAVYNSKSTEMPGLQALSAGVFLFFPQTPPSSGGPYPVIRDMPRRSVIRCALMRDRDVTILRDSNPHACPRHTIYDFRQCSFGSCRLICTPLRLPSFAHFSMSLVFQLVSCSRLSVSRSSFAMASTCFCSSDAFSTAFTLISVPRARLALCPAV